MIGQYSLGGPAQQADDPRRGGRRPGRPRGAGEGRHPVLRLGHDPDLLPPDVPRRPARHRSPPVHFPSAGTAYGAGYRPCRTAGPPRSRRGLSTRPGACRSRAVARDSRRRLSYTRPTLDQPTMPTAERTDRPRRAPSVWTAILILYVVWGSTYLGIRVAIESIPPFLMASTRFAVRRPRHARRGRDRPPRRARPALARRAARLVHRRRVADGRRDGRRGLGRADRAVGDRRRPHRDDAGLGRDLRPGLPPRAAAGSRQPSASGPASSASSILVGPSIVFEGSLDPAGIAALLLSPIFWAGGSVFAAHGAKLPRDPFVTTALQMLSGASSWAPPPSRPASSAASTRPRSPASRSSRWPT